MTVLSYWITARRLDERGRRRDGEEGDEAEWGRTLGDRARARGGSRTRLKRKEATSLHCSLHRGGVQGAGKRVS